MIAYHIHTNEPDPYDVMGGFERFDLNSIYVPEKNTLVGFINWGFPRGKILDYSDLKYTNIAQAIVEGNKGDVEGEVKGTRDLYLETIKKIAEFGEYYHDCEIHITKPFDGSTNCLVQILSGELRPRGVLLRILDKLGEAVRGFDTDSFQPRCD